MSPRIQRMMLALQCCNFDLIYTPGKYIVISAFMMSFLYSMRQNMLQRIHKGHLRCGKCKRRAREAFHLPGINQNILVMRQKCKTCLKHHYKQTKGPMLIANLPTAPWQKVGMDLFYQNAKIFSWLTIILTFHKLSSSLAHQHRMSSHTKSYFARQWISQFVISDNGPQCSCNEFSDFAKTYGVCHITFSPLYPQANGQAEKGVQIVETVEKFKWQ